MAVRRRLCFLILGAMLQFSAMPGMAAEYIRDQHTAPESAAEVHGPIVVAFVEPDLVRETEKVQTTIPAFISEGWIAVKPRSYYFLRELDKDTSDALDVFRKRETWALGGSIAAESGRLWETVSIGGEYFASLPAYAPDRWPGSGLLKPTQETISVLGQAYVRLAHERQVLTLYRQRYNLPYINDQDSRMVPNTFEGYSIDGRWRHGRFIAGYVDKMKRRASDRFVPMSHAMGVFDKDSGMMMLGIRYESEGRFWLGVIGSVVPDVMSTVYSELDSTWKAGEWDFRFGAQITDQRSVGDDLLTGDKFNTQSVGIRAAASFRNAILTTAFTANGSGARIRSPFGGDPSFSSLMLSDFNLANQKTFKVGISYNAGRIGLIGLSGFINYAHGFGAENAATGNSLADAEEFDLTLDFRPEQKQLRGGWLRLRTAVINPGTARRVIDVRLIFNWTFQSVG